jgi:putative transposase
LHYHIGFRTRRRVPVFRHSSRNDALREILPTVCQRSDYHILELDVEEHWARLLISLKPSDSPAKSVQTIKANSSRLLFEAFPEIEREIGRRSLWSRGYYVRGVGDVSNRVVLEYIAGQKEHHEVELGNSVHLVDFARPNPEVFLDLRPFSHCMAEYNCHFVCCPVGHVGAIDGKFAKPLIAYILRVAEIREFEVIRVSVLADHVHLFAALKPHHAPEHLALTLMNNTSHWFRQHNLGVFKVWDIPGFWTSSAFLRTAGAATTNQVRNHLKRKEILVE